MISIDDLLFFVDGDMPTITILHGKHRTTVEERIGEYMMTLKFSTAQESGPFHIWQSFGRKNK